MNKKTENYIDVVKKLKKEESTLLKGYCKTIRLIGNGSPISRGKGDDNDVMLKEIETTIFATQVKRAILKIAALNNSLINSKSTKAARYPDNQTYAASIKEGILAKYKSRLGHGNISKITINLEELLPNKKLEHCPMELSEETIDRITGIISSEMSLKEIKRISR
jgi:hypothetical protein